MGPQGKASGSRAAPARTRMRVSDSASAASLYRLNDMPPGASDPTLARFSLGPQRNHVLPVVKLALAVNPRLQVMASPWSASSTFPTCRSV